ncbi:hypothetical protein [Sporosarcina ureae]|uniref:hypothetical protein n=1 Tax=Sporosarcina ureae TaxID=1571 RepID=UPI0009DC7ADE|nr:hypothetical protein [Sporosarcina ureae]ARF17825.1 hypothetical protein SporoP17a_11415 [Sporosarcina ureae]
MKIKRLAPMQRLAIIISTLMVVGGFLIVSQMYFTYSENRAMSNGCYDRGGFPTVEKSGLSISYFDCNMNP